MTKPLSALSGRHAYSIHGFMHNQNIANQAELNAASVDIAGAGNLIAKWGSVPKTIALPTAPAQQPVLTAFYPADYPAPPAPPSTRPATLPPPGPSYSPNVGYYPFSEVGVIDFAADGSLTGFLRVNTAGYPAKGFTTVDGVYDLANASAPALPVAGGADVGTFTLRMRAPLENHVWEYAFIAVSKTEFVLMLVGRVPRPATGTGVMHALGKPRTA